MSEFVELLVLSCVILEPELSAARTLHEQDRWVPTSGFQTGDLQPVAPDEIKHVLTLVCVIKPMCAWNLQVSRMSSAMLLACALNHSKQLKSSSWLATASPEPADVWLMVSAPVLVCLQETATTCRERCGGGGYLAANRFGSLIGFAHAGMTAEGDNSVLFQKVARELLTTPEEEAAARVTCWLCLTGVHSEKGPGKQ